MPTPARIRAVRNDDAAAIASIDAAHTGVLKRGWWREAVARHSGRRHSAGPRVGLVEVEGKTPRVVGYVLGQVRSFEFGSEPCARRVCIRQTAPAGPTPVTAWRAQ